MTSTPAGTPGDPSDQDGADPRPAAAAETAGEQPVSPFERFSNAPAEQGLYHPDEEKDACGLAVVATLNGTPTHGIVDAALTALRNLEHRGAVGGDEGTGDGAGLLTQLPDAFFRAVLDFELPAPGGYAVGTAFLPTGGHGAQKIQAGLEELAGAEQLQVLGWRPVPVVESVVGASARAVMPWFVQLFVAEPEP